MGSALSCSSKGALLHVLAANGDVATAQELLKKHPKAALYTNFKDRSSPLIQAAARGHFELLQTILETAVMVEGPDKAKRLCIDHRNAKRQTALSVACKHGHADCVEYLVTNGADPLVADARRHNTCLHFAALYGHTECVHKLLGTRATLQQQGRPTTVSQLLCHDGDGSTVTRFIDRHNGWGLSALHIAVFQGSVNTVRALLRHGASLDSVIVAAEIENSPIRCAVGSNALHIAALVGNISMAKVILEAQESVPGLELRSRTDAAGLRPGEYAQRARNPVLVHLLDERLPVSLLRQIWMNYSLEQSMPPRHQTLGAMLQKLKLMFNLELIAVQRNLAASAQEASDAAAAAAAAGGAAGVGRASSAGPTNHSVSAHLLRSSSTTAGTRRSTTADSPMLSADQYQQVQQRALWLKRQEEVQVLLQSVTQLHVTLQGLCRRAEDGSSTEWPGGSSSSQEAVLDFILSTLITPRTVSAIVYAAKKLVCSNVMAVVAANPTGSSTPTLPAEVDVQHGIALLSTALRAVETCLQAASHLSNPAALAAEPVAALVDAARAAAAQQAGDEGAAPAAAPAPAEDGPAIPTTAPGASAPSSGAAADTPFTAPERQAAPASGAAAPVSPGAAGAVPPALASIPAGLPPSSPFLSSHWSAHLHSVIAQLHWDIGVQRHRRRRQHAAQQAARAAAAAAAASNAIVAAEPHVQDLSLLPGRAPVPSSSQATMRQRRRQSGRSVARSTGQMPAPSVTGDSTQPTAFMPGSGMLQSPAGGAHAGRISPQGSQPPSFRQADGSEGMLLRSLSIRSAEASNPPDLATPGSGGTRSASTGRNVMDGSANGEILPQYTDATSCRPEGPSQVSGSGVSLAACTQQRTACSSDKRSVDQGAALGELSEDLSGGEEDAGSMWSDDDSMLCSICMDQPVAVQVTGCQHGLCVQCAFQLTVKGRELPSCPFCRQKIPAFEARPTDTAGANAAASPAGGASLPKAA